MKWFICIFLLHYLESQSIAKSAFCDGYFACYFDCCESGTFQRHAYLLRQVQFIVGYRIYSTLSALWNILKSSDLSDVNLQSDVHLHNVWEKKKIVVDFRDDALRKAYFCGFIIIFHIIQAKLLLVLARLSRSISPQVYCHQLLWQTNSCSCLYKIQDQKKPHFFQKLKCWCHGRLHCWNLWA